MSGNIGSISGLFFHSPGASRKQEVEASVAALRAVTELVRCGRDQDSGGDREPGRRKHGGPDRAPQRHDRRLASHSLSLPRPASGPINYIKVPTAQGKQGKWPKNSLSGKTQGIRKFCQNSGKTQGNWFAQLVNSLILKVKDISNFAAKISNFF